MAATLVEAYDQILSRFKAQWDADTPAATGGAVPEVVYEEKTKNGTPPVSGAPFARVTVRHEDGRAAAIGGTLFTQSGTVFVQVFAPDNGANPKRLAFALSDIAKNAYQGQATASVRFRNVRINEIGWDGPFYQVNVLADFEYDERK